MHKIISNLQNITKEINLKESNKKSPVKIIAVSKTFSLEKIMPLIEYGHIHFGENKVQESIDKWSKIRNKIINLKLHFIGKLQTNKVKYVIPFFDYIHSLDSIKLAEKIHNQQNKTNFKPKLFVQVNLGEEKQKSGISVANLDDFLKNCKNNFDLNILGLMCIPPISSSPKRYFEKMKRLNERFGFRDLSMGMSSDYLEAIKFGSSFVRIGSKIFGPRS